MITFEKTLKQIIESHGAKYDTSLRNGEHWRVADIIIDDDIHEDSFVFLDKVEKQIKKIRKKNNGSIYFSFLGESGAFWFGTKKEINYKLCEFIKNRNKNIKNHVLFYCDNFPPVSKLWERKKLSQLRIENGHNFSEFDLPWLYIFHFDNNLKEDLLVFDELKPFMGNIYFLKDHDVVSRCNHYAIKTKQQLNKLKKFVMSYHNKLLMVEEQFKNYGLTKDTNLIWLRNPKGWKFSVRIREEDLVPELNKYYTKGDITKKWRGKTHNLATVDEAIKHLNDAEYCLKYWSKVEDECWLIGGLNDKSNHQNEGHKR